MPGTHTCSGPADRSATPRSQSLLPHTVGRREDSKSAMSLSDLVLSIADNKQMLGLRYAEWATRAPSLEADIAAAAMGLDDLGHSRVLYGCLEPLGEDPRGPERETDPG